MREQGIKYVADLAIPCHTGTVTIAVGDHSAPSHSLRDPDPETVQRAVERLGGALPIRDVKRDG